MTFENAGFIFVKYLTDPYYTYDKTETIYHLRKVS